MRQRKSRRYCRPRFPNLLVNGTNGIAVGMATNIPPHNLREVIGAVVKMIDNRIDGGPGDGYRRDSRDHQGTGFPDGSTDPRKHAELRKRTAPARGKIRVRAVTNIEPMPNGKSRIIVTETSVHGKQSTSDREDRRSGKGQENRRNHGSAR